MTNLEVSSHLNETPSQKIRLLPEHLVDQIKAGEVIERPASLIKEVLENSIDAGSTKIEIHLINNGLDLISVEDNGEGMIFEDLPFAFCRHATSKISRFEDIYGLNSFGFRGEALASISSISRITCTSSPNEDNPRGGKIIIHGAEVKSHALQPGLKKGTKLFIKDLFYNTPARLKFVKSQISEKNALKRIITSFLLSNPKITFSVKWDEADKVVYQSTASIQERVSQILTSKGKKSAALFSFKSEYEGHNVWGFVSQESGRGNSGKKHYLFANNRLFTDRQIHQTIIRNMANIYPEGETGHYCIFINAPANLIDVNVHPNKTQIKFFKLPVITGLLSSSLKGIIKKSFENKEKGKQDDLFSRTSSEGTHTKDESSPAKSSFPTKPRDDSFFSKSQEQAFQPTVFQQKINQQIGPFQLYQCDKKVHLFSKERFIRLLLEGEPFPFLQQESEFIPLLISEPIQVNLNGERQIALIEKLSSIGFQLEVIDDSLVLLQGHHQIWSRLDLSLSPFVEGLLKYLLNKSISEINEIIFSQELIFNLSSKIGPNTNYLSLLDEVTLTRIFND